MLLVLVGLPQAYGQVSARYSFVWRGLPLETALTLLVTETQLDLAYDPLLVQGVETFCIAREQVPEDILRCVLQGTGLDFYRRSTGTYVLTPRTETEPLYGALTGLVVDAETGEPLANAHVILDEEDAGRASNASGRFSFPRLKPGTYRVTASHIGYHTTTTLIEVRPGNAERTELALLTEPILVGPIVADGLATREMPDNLARITFTRENLLNQPRSSGTADVLTSLDALMGVHVNDATADVHVQGGDAGEHQFRLDGAPVFIPPNIATFIGPFSPFALGRITVHKAGFGAGLGSQAAGVIEAEHDLSVSAPYEVDVQVAPLSANARLSLQRGNPGYRQTTAMVAGRYGLWRLHAPPSLQSLLHDWNLIDPFLQSAFSDPNASFSKFNLTPVGNPGIDFYDLHGASRIRFGLLRSLYTSAYWGQSRLDSDLSGDGVNVSPVEDPVSTGSTFRDAFTWETGVAQARYEAVLNARTLLNVRLRGSYYRLRHDFISLQSASVGSDEDDGNRVYETAIDGVIDYTPSSLHSLHIGSELTRTNSRFVLTGSHIPIAQDYGAWRWAGFVEDEITPTPYVTLTGGMRLTYLPSHRSAYAEPRLAVRFDPPPTRHGQWTLQLSTGLYRQFVNQFDLSSRGPRTLASNTRFWLAVDSTVAPPRALHLSGELLYRPAPAWAVHFETYYKAQHHILTVDYAAQQAPGDEDFAQRDFLRASRGATYGSAVRIERRIGLGRAQARYEYSRSRRRTEDLFKNAWYFVPWNTPHRFELALDLTPLPRVTVLTRWRSIWGRTWGFRQAYYDFIGAHLNDVSSLPVISAQLAEIGVFPEAIGRIARQIDAYDFTLPDALEHRLPPLHQLDLSVGYAVPIGQMTLQARADILNVLGRDNVAEWLLAQEDPEAFRVTGLLEPTNRYVLPRVTSFALRLSW